MVQDYGTKAPGSPFPTTDRKNTTLQAGYLRVQLPCPTRHRHKSHSSHNPRQLPPTPASIESPQPAEAVPSTLNPIPVCVQDTKPPKHTSALPARPGASELLPSGTDIFIQTRPHPETAYNGRYPPPGPHGSRDTRREILRQPRHRWSGGGPGVRCRPHGPVISLVPCLFRFVFASVPCLTGTLPRRHRRLELDRTSRC